MPRAQLFAVSPKTKYIRNVVILSSAIEIHVYTHVYAHSDPRETGFFHFSPPTI